MNETLKSAIKHHGVPFQMLKVIEECSELQKAILKAMEAGIIKDFGIIPPYLESNPNEVKTYHDLVDEAADVAIMVEYLEILLGKEKIEARKKFKIERLKNKLNQ